MLFLLNFWPFLTVGLFGVLGLVTANALSAIFYMVLIGGVLWLGTPIHVRSQKEKSHRKPSNPETK